ncbi:MAG: ABC transporter permease [Promethearchaeota archaeon]
MVNLTFRDLIHNKTKFLLIVIGLSVSMFLVQYSAGMYNGVLEQSTDAFDRFDFDTWVMTEDADNFFEGGPINDSTYEIIKTMTDVEDAERLIFANVNFETKDYVADVTLLGYELNSEKIEPWDIIKGDIEDLDEENTVIIDETIKNNFPELKIADDVQIGEAKMKIVGFCKNTRFMFTPYAWASIETARNAIPYYGNWSNMIGVELKSDSDVDDLQDNIDELSDLGIIEDLKVFTKQELKENTHTMIINEGGLGGAIYTLVGLGFFVAMIIITVVMYQSIQEKIPEFGTLKAIGASKGFINKMLLGQVFIYITLSFILGTFFAILFDLSGGGAGMPILLDIFASIYIYLAYLAVGIACSMFSIKKVHRIDPAIVFKG